MRKGIMAAGALSLFLGVILAVCHEQPDPKESIWEEARLEEIYTNIREEEQREGIPEPWPVEELEEGSDPEEPQEAAGQVMEFTAEDAALLMRVAQAEAGNQGEEGMRLVMSVVLNRVSSSEFPNSIEEVIFQPHQFSSVSDGHFEKEEVFSTEVHEALARIQEGDVEPEIVGFEVVSSDELDKYFASAFEYREHRFYTQKGD